MRIGSFGLFDLFGPLEMQEMLKAKKAQQWGGGTAFG